MQTALGAMPCGEGDTAPHAKRWGQKPTRLGATCSLSPPPAVALSQTLWFDLQQRLSDSESTACTVRAPAGCRGVSGIRLEGGSPCFRGSHVLLCFLGGLAVPPPGAERDDGVAQAPGRVLQFPEAVPEERGRGAGLLPVGTAVGLGGSGWAGGCPTALTARGTP